MKILFVLAVHGVFSSSRIGYGEGGDMAEQTIVLRFDESIQLPTIMGVYEPGGSLEDAVITEDYILETYSDFNLSEWQVPLVSSRLFSRSMTLPIIEGLRPTLGISASSVSHYPRGVFIIPTNTEDMELIISPNNLNEYCAENSFVYVGDDSWIANVHVQIDDANPLRLLALVETYRFEFRTSEPMDSMPEPVFNQLVNRLGVHFNNPDRIIVNDCSASTLVNFPNIVFHMFNNGVPSGKIATIIYYPSDYLEPIRNTNTCLLKMKSSNNRYHFGITFFRQMGVHLMGDRIGICDPR
jgi:hypothetical protein